MKPAPRPHVSDAIRQLRVWVTLFASVLGICCVVQALVFGFAAYTDARWTEVKPAQSEHTLKVVAPATPASSPTAVAASGHVAGGMRAIAGERITPAPEVNRITSAADLHMRRVSSAACGLGVLSAAALFALTMLGAIVAGGGAVPGVERAVTAAVWSMILAMLCVPWERVLPGLGVPGVFADYSDLVSAVEARALAGASAAPLALLAQWVLAPFVAALAATGVVLWFRAGVEKGVIVLAPSELDKAVAREVELIQKRGVASATPKAIGALNRAIGDGESRQGAPAGTVSAVERELEERELVGSGVGASGQRAPRGVADDDYKRPI